jgi:uncharacterized protein
MNRRYEMEGQRLVGRQIETEQLLSKLDSNKAELVAVLGRRRIGKTFLVNEVYKPNMLFQFTGLFKSNLGDHMSRFAKRLQEAYHGKYDIETPNSWFEAFDLLQQLVEDQKSKSKKVIFLDEFPWMATNKSKFLTAFTDFWNSFASKRKDLIVVICGSSASWMINKVLKNKGGLHNRVTERVKLNPFCLAETKQFLAHNKINYTESEITKLYMVLGGVPYYLSQINKGESVTQAIDRLCFKKDAPMQIEFNELFASLFLKSEVHKKIIEILCTNPTGLSRLNIIQKVKLKSGGSFTYVLEELIHSGFVDCFVPYGKKTNEGLYKVIDFYVLFYQKYIKRHIGTQAKVWEKLSTQASYKSWSGLAFENICMQHITQIYRALKIDGIYATHYAWYHKGSKEMSGAQIDLLIERADNIINICEIKFTQDAFIITKDYAQKLKLKLAAFKHFSKTRKALFTTFITTEKLVNNTYKQDLIQNEVLLASLFD